MNPGDVILLPVYDNAGGIVKLRPTLFLSVLPGPYQTILVCGFSTKLHVIRSNWDELVQPGDSDYASSGLRQASVIRLSFLQSARPIEVSAIVGQIDPARLARLRQRISDHLRP